MSERDQLFEQALALSREDRAYLADALEYSLATEDFATEEIAKAWVKELEDRIAAYDRGEILASDAMDSLKRMRARINRKIGKPRSS